MKHKILITAIFIFLSICVKAQDKYQFMVIEYRSSTTTLFVSIDGNLFTKGNIEFAKEEKDFYNANPLLKRVKEYQEKGWEVMNFNNSGGVGGSANSYISYLRKRSKPNRLQDLALK